MYFEDLLIKTLEAESADEIDNKCMTFRKDNMIKATQANILYIPIKDKLK